MSGSAGVTGAEGRGRFAKIWLSQGCDDRRLGRGARRRKPAASLAWAAQRAQGCGGKDVTWEETPTERRRRRVYSTGRTSTTSDRQSVGLGKSVSVRVDLVGRRIIKKQTK